MVFNDNNSCDDADYQTTSDYTMVMAMMEITITLVVEMI